VAPDVAKHDLDHLKKEDKESRSSIQDARAAIPGLDYAVSNKEVERIAASMTYPLGRPSERADSRLFSASQMELLRHVEQTRIDHLVKLLREQEAETNRKHAEIPTPSTFSLTLCYTNDANMMTGSTIIHGLCDTALVQSLIPIAISLVITCTINEKERPSGDWIRNQFRLVSLSRILDKHSPFSSYGGIHTAPVFIMALQSNVPPSPSRPPLASLNNVVASARN